MFFSYVLTNRYPLVAQINFMVQALIFGFAFTQRNDVRVFDFLFLITVGIKTRSDHTNVLKMEPTTPDGSFESLVSLSFEHSPLQTRLGPGTESFVSKSIDAPRHIHVLKILFDVRTLLRTY
jgi:hypothetical protein